MGRRARTSGWPLKASALGSIQAFRGATEEDARCRPDRLEGLQVPPRDPLLAHVADEPLKGQERQEGCQVQRVPQAGRQEGRC